MIKIRESILFILFIYHRFFSAYAFVVTENLLSFCHVETLWELSIFQSSFGRRFLPHTHSPQRETSRRGSVPPGGLHRGLRAVHGVPDRNIRFGSTGPKNWAGLHQGVGGVPPLVETVLRLPPGGPWTSGRDPRGDPPPPRGEGGVPSGVLSDDRAGGYPGGGTPGGLRDPKKGGSRGGSKSAQNICQKKGN